MASKCAASSMSPRGNSAPRDAAITMDLYGRLVSAVRYRWRGPDAEDVVQDAFLRLSMAERRTAIHDPAAFLYVAALNLIRDRARSAATRAAAGSTVFALGQVVSPTPSVERCMASRQHMAILDDALAELPANTRDAFTMYRFDELPHAQIAARLGLSVSMVEKHVRRASRHCRARLDSADAFGEARESL